MTPITQSHCAVTQWSRWHCTRKLRLKTLYWGHSDFLVSHLTFKSTPGIYCHPAVCLQVFKGMWSRSIFSFRPSLCLLVATCSASVLPSMCPLNYAVDQIEVGPATKLDLYTENDEFIGDHPGKLTDRHVLRHAEWQATCVIGRVLSGWQLLLFSSGIGFSKQCWDCS